MITSCYKISNLQFVIRYVDDDKITIKAKDQISSRQYRAIIKENTMMSLDVIHEFLCSAFEMCQEGVKDKNLILDIMELPKNIIVSIKLQYIKAIVINLDEKPTPKQTEYNALEERVKALEGYVSTITELIPTIREIQPRYYGNNIYCNLNDVISINLYYGRVSWPIVIRTEYSEINVKKEDISVEFLSKVNPTNLYIDAERADLIEKNTAIYMGQYVSVISNIKEYMKSWDKLKYMSITLRGDFIMPTIGYLKHFKGLRIRIENTRFGYSTSTIIPNIKSMMKKTGAMLTSESPLSSGLDYAI